MARTAATAEDWGTGFVENGDPGDEGELVLRRDCEVIIKDDRPGTLAVLIRNVARKEPATEGYSESRVYNNVTTAKKYLADIQEGIHRCPAQHEGQARYEGIREAANPPVSGFDTVVSEVGRKTVGIDGEKLNQAYLAMTGRKKEAVLQVTVFGPAEAEAELSRLAAHALQRMEQRLPAQ